MSIKILDFGNKGNTGLRQTLELIISKKSEAIINKKHLDITQDLKDLAEDWQTEVRAKLSKKVQGTYGTSSYIRNTDLWPRMQEGRLVRDVLKPTVYSEYKAKPKSIRKNQIRFRVNNFYGPRIETIGLMLDQMKNYDGTHKTFANWLTRANRVWDELMGRQLTSRAKRATLRAKRDL